eukprot:6372182-Prymnesium_polylepis.1
MDEALAQQLRMQLKPARGPAPKVEHVCAALLVARATRSSSLQGLPSGEVVPGVPGLRVRTTESPSLPYAS